MKTTLKTKKLFLTLILFIVLLQSSIMYMYYSINSKSENMLYQQRTVFKYISNIKKYTSAAHLWMMEYISGDTVEEAKKVPILFEKSKQQFDNFLQLKNSKDIEIFLKYMRNELLLLRDLSATGLSSNAIAGSEQDIEFDDVYVNFIAKLDSFNDMLERKFEEDFLNFKKYKTKVYILMGISLIMIFIFVFILYNSEMKRVKAQEEAKIKSEFLTNISHEIRTPLNSIMGFTDFLKEKEDDKEKIKYLNTIDKASNHLLEIINDILDFSKIEKNQINLEYREFNILDKIESIHELYKESMLEKNLTFNLRKDKDIPKYIYSDSLKIKQVIINLVSNAIKFTEHGKTIEVSVSYTNGNLNISVKDEGIGITKDKQKTIFEAFNQADNSTTREYGGTGLGLTISYKLIEALGGVLKLKSAPNIGSEFYFSIPAKIVHVESKKDADIKDKPTKLSGHILLVEDNKANQMFMKVLLKKLGLTFDIAFNGLEAIDKFENNQNETKYDLILMDENMPNTNGIEATKNILKMEKDLKLSHTPIVALTANSLEGDRERFLNAGMDEYLTKPVDKNKLSLVLQEFLNK